MKRKLFLLTLLFFSFSMLFAAPGPDFHKKGHKNFHGKRLMEEDGEFHLLFIEAKEFPNFINFKFVFSQPVNPESLGEGIRDGLVNENFLLNGHVIQFEKIRFSKNYRVLDFLTKAENGVWSEENMEFTVKDIESINGKKMEPVVIKNFQVEKDYKLMKKGER